MQDETDHRATWWGRRIIQHEGWSWVLVRGCPQIQEMYVFHKAGTTARSSTKQEAGRGVPIYVRMNVSYDQTVAKGSLQKATSIWAWVQLVGQW